MRKKVSIDFIIPIAAVLLFTFFMFLGGYRNFENRIYDLMLHIKPAVTENESILLLDIDDTSLEKVGVWPWSRDMMADGLILMKEFNALFSVFDIEYTEESPRGINASFLEDEIPELFSKEFSQISSSITDLFNALTDGYLPISEAGEYIEDLTGITEEAKISLLSRVDEIVRNNDIYLGQAAYFFENAFFTINMLPEEEETTSPALAAWADNHAIGEIEVTSGKVESAVDIRPAILPVVKDAAGVGFPNIIVDSDGVRRRVNLIYEYDGKYFPQLAFAPLYSWLGSPGIIVTDNQIILKNAEIPGKEKADIAIPLTEDGKVLINWPKSGYADSFNHMSYYYLILHGRQEQQLISNLKVFNEKQYFYYYEGDYNPLELYAYGSDLKNDILLGASTESLLDYREIRDLFFEETGNFLSGTTLNTITGIIDDILASDEYSDDEKAYYAELRTETEADFELVLEGYEDLVKTREILDANLNGAFCIIGLTATSTSDIGVNPFEKTYMNVGTHASLVNTILSESFLDMLPWWYSALLAVILTAVVFFISRKFEPLPALIAGSVVVVFTIGFGIILFIFTGLYLSLLTPTLSVLTTFISMTFLTFLNTSKEKAYIKKAFSHYLSADVINDLLSDPDKLNLGGEKKLLTALFTDVRGFSTISENLDPTELVKILNHYLTDMSDIILDLRGTIDKYEGDAIICFFGAPVEFDDHASRACLSAVRMKKAEAALNIHFEENKISPNPLFTRIGVNTGEMVVGNMGTAQKMDYTIMGASVNLAARLEGVNKQYGTWILISEQTCKAAGDDFLVRELDRVRVVGMKEPVRLYELIDEKNKADDKILNALENFSIGLRLFEEKAWDDAKLSFAKVIKLYPDDGPATTFTKRCNDYIKKAPPKNWDGVFNLTMK